MQIDYRLLRQGDDAVLGRVAAGVFDEPVRPDRVAAYLAEPNHHLLVAIADGLVVGQVAAVVHRHPDKPAELYIDEVGVGDDWLRRGIARRMMEAMFAFGRSIGCAECWVGTEGDNEPAIALYRGFGAEPVHLVYFEYSLLRDNAGKVA
ncbi:MAG: GNAT family N-acetyltransferase [Rhizobiaceae bacterium]|nr:GNAT family N-acetyltransferase [Rhizobiaceae bacterium]